jgi:predicted NBD/HSP70 family sugar kinase
LILSLVRHHRSLTKAEIARLTGLSLQASSVITHQLEQEGLLIRGEPLRGKVGQPAVPLSLDPEGAFAIGLKYGCRGADLALMDFVGNVRGLVRTHYDYPTPVGLEKFVRRGVGELTADLLPRRRERICGLGIAAPFDLWSWVEEVGGPPEAIAAWRGFDFRESFAKLCRWPVHYCKDATAACAAELAFGTGSPREDFLYVYIATLIGGGVVLNGELFPGHSGYAGSIGSIFVPGEGGKPQCLIRRASLYLLERSIAAAGGDPAILRQSPKDWTSLGAVLDEWVEQATDALSFAIGSAISVVDFQAVMIDGALPPAVRTTLVERTRAKFAALDIQGVAPVEIIEGSLGADAGVLGAATLPLLGDFTHAARL